MIVELNHKIMPDGKRYSEWVCDSDGVIDFVIPENVCVGSKLTIIDKLDDYKRPITLYYSGSYNNFTYGDTTLDAFVGEPQDTEVEIGD